MTDPTPRPPVGTDLAPCPDCGGDLDPRVGEDDDGQWWDIDCAGTVDRDGCGWCAYEVEALEPFTLAGAPWTRALWAEVERLRVLATNAASFLDVDRCAHDSACGRCEAHGGQRLPCAHGEARRLLTEMGERASAAMQAADAAEAAAVAKEGT